LLRRRLDPPDCRAGAHGSIGQPTSSIVEVNERQQQLAGIRRQLPLVVLHAVIRGQQTYLVPGPTTSSTLHIAFSTHDGTLDLHNHNEVP
jgi:hypothetical protein